MSTINLPTGTPAIEEPNREKQQKGAVIEAMKARCKVCFKEIAPKQLCGGHGGGGGGGEAAGNSGEQAGKEGSIAPVSSTLGQTSTNPTAAAAKLIAGATLPAAVSSDPDQQFSLDKSTFNPEIIAKLLSTGLLTVDDDAKQGILTIKLNCVLKILTEEQKNEFEKFVRAILNELHKFKKENGIKVNCETISEDKKRNILSVRMVLPTLQLYDAFIQQLANNLLPKQNIATLENSPPKNYFNQTLFAPRRSVAPNKEESVDEKQSTKQQKTTPAIRPWSPADGPRPPGGKKLCLYQPKK